MIDIQLYRARIGVFTFTNIYGISLERSKGKKGYQSHSKGNIKIIILVTTLALVCMIILNSFKVDFFKIAGDVELNPGPYEIIKSVQGSFDQVNISLFGETTGRQCACKAMFSICWSLIRKISCWTHRDLDRVLNEGGNLYNSLNKESFLNVDHLPRQIYIFQYSVNLEMTEKTLHEGIALLGEPFLRNIFPLSHNSTGCLLFICNYVVAIIRYSTTRYTPYFLFDSHCRNSCGITDSPFVFSVLLQFADLIQKERYIEEFYNVANLAYPPYFQVQFISVNVDDLNLSSIQACQV